MALVVPAFRIVRRLIKLWNNPRKIDVEVTVNDTGVTCQYSEGDVEWVSWDKLEAVVIETTAWGPWCEDFHYYLEGEDGLGCCISLGKSIETDLLERLSRLPGFDQDAHRAAVASTDFQEFVCWRRG